MLCQYPIGFIESLQLANEAEKKLRSYLCLHLSYHHTNTACKSHIHQLES